MVRACQRGAVYLEFLVVVIPLLTFFLCLVQLALLLGAQLLVSHGAGKAARAAIVVLPDDHEEADYEGVPLNQVGFGASGLDAYREAPAGGRYETIRMAARYSLSPVSPSLQLAPSSTVADGMASSPLGALAGLLGWTRFAVALAFPTGENSYASSFAPRESITCQVVYLFKCQVPLGKDVICDSYGSLDSTARELLEIKGGQLALAHRFSGWKFKALGARVTLPNQGRI